MGGRASDRSVARTGAVGWVSGLVSGSVIGGVAGISGAPVAGGVV
jgi:hypothetical protein